jgi:hypothetical protein
VSISGPAEAAFLPVAAAGSLCPEGGPLTAHILGSAQIF